MRKLKKKIIINNQEYSTNEAKKFLSNILKKNNINKENRCKIVDLLSKHESYKFNQIVIDDFFIIEIVLFNNENKNRVNNHGENILQKRSILAKTQKYISIFKEILDSEVVFSNIKRILNTRVNSFTKVADIGEEFDFSNFLFNVKNGLICVDILGKNNCILTFETNDKKFYSCHLEPNLYYLQENISKKFEDICKIKSYLQI